MRARDIKPGFYKNDQLAECSLMARYIYPGLWMVADREGRFEDRPKRLKAELLPYDDADMDSLLNELQSNGLIVRYEIGGKRYVWIPKFHEHQRPHSNEKKSEIPPCPQELSSKEQTPSESTSDQGEKCVQPRREALRPSSLTPSSLTPEENTSPPVETSGNQDPARALNVAGEVGEQKSVVIDLSGEPGIEFQELRAYYDEHFRPEAPLRGFPEYKQLRASGRWPGQAALHHDLDARLEAGSWNKGFAPSLATYLRERTWKAPIRAAPTRWLSSGRNDLQRVLDKNAETFRRVAERRAERSRLAAQGGAGGA